MTGIVRISRTMTLQQISIKPVRGCCQGSCASDLGLVVVLDLKLVSSNRSATI